MIVKKKKKRPQYNLPIIIFASILVLGSFSIFNYNYLLAQAVCTNQTTNKSENQLRQELKACEKERDEAQKEVNRLKGEGASFARDIATLTAKINVAQANIRGKNSQITLLTRDISVKQSKITTLDSRIVQGRKSIADILRRTNNISSYSLVEAMLSNKGLSEFFVDIDTYASTGRALSNLFTQLRKIRTLTEAERSTLNEKREKEAAARAVIVRAKKTVEINQAQKKTLLAINKTNTKTYEQVVADRQAKATQIKAVLFPLRDSAAIPFGVALQYAEAAKIQTGVRPAFVLAILQKESNLGANVGSCVITNLFTGETKGVNTGRTFANGIHPTRDLPILQGILNTLGRDPFQTKVSCPVARVAGYGGAMGPAQFIPSTWNLMVKKISSALNKSTPDPWIPADAIMASSIFLGDLGASTQDWTNERTAACRYYSGKTCYSRGRPNVGLGYGNSVMRRAASIQRDIDFLQNL